MLEKLTLTSRERIPAERLPRNPVVRELVSGQSFASDDLGEPVRVYGVRQG